jgi:hypothetical protein
MEVGMRMAITAALVGAALLGCKKGGEESGRVGGAVDTVVTSRQTQDTAVITTDTTVKVETDTNVDKGDRSTRVDTVAKKKGALPADSDKTK